MTHYSDFSLEDEIDTIGMWWFASDEETVLPGRLHYKPSEHIELTLYGSTDEFSRNYANLAMIADVICGVTETGLKCSLLDSRSLGTVNRSTGLSTLAVDSDYLIIGRLLDAHHELTFDFMACWYRNLDSWLNEKVVSVDIVDANKYSATYERPAPRRVPVQVRAGSVSLQYASHMSNNVFNQVRIASEPNIVFEPESSVSLTEYRRTFFEIQHLLSLMMGQATSIDRLLGFNRGEPVESVNILYVQTEPEVPLRRSHQMGVSFESISTDFEDILETWFSKVDLLRPTIDLFFGYLGRSDQYLHAQFLAIVQAIENFHRVVRGGQYGTDEEYAPLLADLKSAIPSDFDKDWRKSLEGKLEYGNEYSLSKRLKEIFRGLTDNERALITDQYKKFINDVVTTRNYHVHYSKKLESKALSNAEMAHALWKLKKLLAVLLLKELGFTEAQVVEAMQRARFH